MEIGAFVDSTLRSFGYKFTNHSNEWRFECATKSNRWRSQLWVNDDLVRLRIQLIRDGYLAEFQDRVFELAMRLDNEIGVCGSFEIDYDLGSVSYRSFHSFAHAPITTEAIADLLNHCAYPLRCFELAYPAVFKPKVRIKDAVAGAISLAGEDDALMTTLARRAMLTLVS